MLFFLALAQVKEVRDRPGLGFHSYDLPAQTRLVIENPDAAHRVFMSWSGEADDDPSVVIACTLFGVRYVHRPLLVNYAFPVGEIVRFQSDSVVTVQIWVLPMRYCAPSTFFYSAAHLVSDEFTLTDSVADGLCLFFNGSPGRNRVVAAIRSKRVDYFESRVEVVAADFHAANCSKEKCDVDINGRFFVRFVGAKAGLRLLVEAFFEKHDILGACVRNSVPVWDGNLSYTVDLRAVDDDFICDEPGRLTRKKQKKWLIWGCWISVAVLAVVYPFIWKDSLNDGAKRVPMQLQDFPASRRRRP
jgi:hypothetical protein